MLQRFFLFLIFYSSMAVYATEIQKTQPIRLTLKDAILLAIRENPNIQQAQLNHIQQKFALDVAHWQFQPHYAILAGSVINQNKTFNQFNSNRNWGIQPQASWLSPIGTQVALINTNTVTKHYNPGLSLQVTQPLIRGFGKAIVEAALFNAIDNEKISRLNVQNALQTTITNVINAYLTVVSGENTLRIDQDALKRADLSVEQTRLFIKAGRKAGVELVAVQASAANAQTTLENDRNALRQSVYALLAAIGVDPTTEVYFSDVNVPQLIQKYPPISLEEAKKSALENDIQYQVDQITIAGSTKRALQSAENNAKWILDVTTTAGVGSGSGGGVNAGVNSLINGVNQARGVQVNLTIPIDDRNAKQAISAAKISLKEAELALKQEKWAKETSAINSWNTIISAKRAMRFAEEAEQLQEKTYQISFQKFKYGLIDGLELQTAQHQLIQRQQELLNARINYLRALILLDLQIGKTLKTWDIQVRYA